MCLWYEIIFEINQLYICQLCKDVITNYIKSEQS